MRGMVVVLVMGLAGCFGIDGATEPDAGPTSVHPNRDAAVLDLSQCFPDWLRSQDAKDPDGGCSLTLTLPVLDFVTRAPPTVPVELRYDTAWEYFFQPYPFQIMCSLASGQASSANQFTVLLDQVSCVDGSRQPIIGLYASDPAGAPPTWTLSINDRKTPAAGCLAGCAMTVPTWVVSRATLATWRHGNRALRSLDWNRDGLAVITYRDRAGQPVAGVTPIRSYYDAHLGFQTRPLLPGQEVLFLAADRLHFQAGDTTGPSGSVVVPLPNSGGMDLTGSAAGVRFETLGIGTAPGAVYFEQIDEL